MKIGEWQQSADCLTDTEAKELHNAIDTLLKWPPFYNNYKELSMLKSVLKFQRKSPNIEVYRQRFHS